MNKYPIIKFTLLFIIGILTQSFFQFPTLYYLLSVVLITFIVIIGKISNFVSKPKFYQLSFTIVVILFGSIYLSLHQTKNASYPFELPKIKNAEIKGLVLNVDLLSNKKLSMEFELIKLNNERVEGNKFILNIWNDKDTEIKEIYNKLKIGAILNLKGNVSRAKNKRNPGEFDYEKYLNKNGVSGIINCYKPSTIKITNGNSEILKNIVFATRKIIDEKIRELHDSTSAALLKGILLADRKDINYEIRESFINSGVIHVLAVSGLHVGFIAGIFFLLFSRFNIRIKYLLTIFGIILFLILTGGHASVFRASIMAITLIIAKLTGRSTNGFNSISIAALILLAIDPKELFNPGFQLSFSAVLSILIIYPIFSEKINKYKLNKFIKNILLFVSVSFAAQVGTLPFTLAYFNKLSLVSLFANIIVIPSIGIIVALGILAIIISLLSFSIASIFASANMMIIHLLYLFVTFTSKITFSFLPIYNFSLFDGILFYVFLILVLFMIKQYKNRILLIISILLAFVGLQNFFLLDDVKILPDGKLSIVAMDVGQGDAILIKFPNNKIALIDAGNCTDYFDNGERVIYPLLQQFGIDKINTAYISHMDSDHFAGVLSLVERNIIDTIFKPYDPTSIKDKIFEEYISANNIDCKFYSEKSFNVGGVQLYLLNDTSQTIYKNFDSNNKSGIIKLIYGNNSFLFVGDAEVEAEEYLVSLYGRFLNSDVLKIGHHGSNTSSSMEFIDMVKPNYGIISAGLMNKFKHPSSKIIERFSNKNVNISRTDYEGAIIFTSDGSRITKIDWRK